MSKDWEIEGKKKKVGGKVEEFVGEMVGDRDTAARGKARQTEGGLQEGAGQIKHAVERKLRGDRDTR